MAPLRLGQNGSQVTLADESRRRRLWPKLTNRLGCASAAGRCHPSARTAASPWVTTPRSPSSTWISTVTPAASRYFFLPRRRLKIRTVTARRQIAPPLVAFRRRARQLLRPCKNVFYNPFVCSVAETELNVFIVQRVQIYKKKILISKKKPKTAIKSDWVQYTNIDFKPCNVCSVLT